MLLRRFWTNQHHSDDFVTYFILVFAPSFYHPPSFLTPAPGITSQIIYTQVLVSGSGVEFCFVLFC